MFDRRNGDVPDAEYRRAFRVDDVFGVSGKDDVTIVERKRDAASRGLRFDVHARERARMETDAREIDGRAERVLLLTHSCSKELTRL